MAREIIPSRGRCPCRVRGCTEAAHIKTQKNSDKGALFLTCPTHGVDRAMGPKAQALLDDWIIDNAIPDGQPYPAPAPAPAPAQASPKPRRRWFSLADMNKDLEDFFNA